MTQAHTCETCTKKWNAHKCAVLTEMIGKHGECWAWSDDPDWFKVAKGAYQEYVIRKTYEAENNAKSAHPNGNRYDVDLDAIITLHEQGLSQYQIAEKLGVTRSAVRWRLRKAGLI